MVLIDHGGPGYDFHLVLRSPDDESVTHAEVAVLNHRKTLRVICEQRLTQMIESLRSVCAERSPTSR